jgi:OHCU decarboxylase
VSLRDLSAEDVHACCGSAHWRRLMDAVLPVHSREELVLAAQRAFDALGPDDWREAFAAHSPIGAPRLGDTLGAREQAGLGTDPATDDALAAANDAYRRRFGWVFLIRARGRSAQEIMAELERRLDNPPETEWAIACHQQREITALRLGDLAAGVTGAAPASASPAAPEAGR